MQYKSMENGIWLINYLAGVNGDLDWDLLAVDSVVWASVTGGADGVSHNVVGKDGGQSGDVLEESCDWWSVKEEISN